MVDRTSTTPDVTSAGSPSLSWVLLTRGDRPDELRAAVDSIDQAGGGEIVVVHNGTSAQSVGTSRGVRSVESAANVGVPAGRNLGVAAAQGEVIAFLDDDAGMRTPGAVDTIRSAFARSPELGAISFRIVDEDGTSSPRHVPRLGGRSAEAAGDVVNFLGGACAIRRRAFEEVGGYWDDLFYAHEELELAWRLHDAGYRVRYVPEIEVFHPRTPISRHAEGWGLTGRNRVLVARRTLPWPVAVVHVTTWLVLGFARAPSGGCRSAYVAGWWHGWRVPVDRRPIRWRTVAALARIGRPPVV